MNRETFQVKSSPFIFEGEDGAGIHAMSWLPSGGPLRAVLIINHGMAEHIHRYHDFASYLALRGFAVYGEDHRGHGKTAAYSGGASGYFAPRDGWMKVISDIRSLYKKVKKLHADLPLFMLGHSMGSFLTRHYISLYGEELQGAVLSGTGSHSAVMLKLASLVAAFEILFQGDHHKSKLLNTLSFGAFNKAFSSRDATGFEWLSRDQKQVQAYVDDPDCGFICTSGFYKDLFHGLEIVNHDRCFEAFPEALPLLILSGSQDPVGGPLSKGVKRVAECCKASGMKELKVIIKEGLRHECLNEKGREEIFEEIFHWFDRHL